MCNLDHTFAIIYTQILKEFDRIFEGAQSKRIKEKWEELIPKVFEVAKNDPSSALQDLYADATQCITKGIIVAIIRIVKIMPDISTESKSLLASMMLIYLLADTRTTATPSRIVIFVDVRIHIMTLIIDATLISLYMQEHCDVSAVARDVDQAQPVIVIRGTHILPQEGYLVTEKALMSKLPVYSLADVPLILFATYFVFNIQYCNGCSNFYSFLEVAFLDAPIPKKTKIRHFINMLDNIQDD